MEFDNENVKFKPNKKTSPLQQRNDPELTFMVDDGIPSVQFVGCKNSSPIRLNIFDVVHVEVYAKDEKLKAKIVPAN